MHLTLGCYLCVFAVVPKNVLSYHLARTGRTDAADRLDVAARRAVPIAALTALLVTIVAFWR